MFISFHNVSTILLISFVPVRPVYRSDEAVSSPISRQDRRAREYDCVPVLVKDINHWLQIQGLSLITYCGDDQGQSSVFHDQSNRSNLAHTVMSLMALSQLPVQAAIGLLPPMHNQLSWYLRRTMTTHTWSWYQCTRPMLINGNAATWMSVQISVWLDIQSLKITFRGQHRDY